MEQPKTSNGLIIAIIVGALFFFGGLTWLVLRLPPDAQNDAPKKDEALTFDDTNAPTMGAASSTVTVHLVGDFQCPACRLAERAVSTVVEAYKGRVKFVWKDFPLTELHPKAEIGAVAARCAQNQGKFWEYHDMLYANQDEWVNDANTSGKLVGYAQQLGLNADMFQSCVATRATMNLVQADEREGARNGIDRTPTFFINNKRYFAMIPTDWFKALDAALAGK